MSALKILHVCKKYPNALGGDATVVAKLQEQQQAAGHKVAIVTSNCNEIMAAPHVYKVGLKDTAEGLDIITIKRIASLVMLFFKMFAVLRKERPNVVHTHSVDMAFFASFAAHFYGIPIIHTFHIVTFYDQTQPLIRRLTETWLAKKARPRTATAPNNYDVKKLQTAGLEQTTLLPNGVDLEFWKTTTQVQKNEKFNFLAVGRLEHQKGYDYLIKAAFLLAQKMPTAFCVTIVGEGSKKTELQSLIKSLQLQDIVALVGRKSPQEIRRLFGSADAAVFPSLYETTPITLLESWAAGVPVVMTSVGILREGPASPSAAIIIPQKNEQLLAEAMHKCIINAPLRTTIAAKGFEETQKFAWPIIGQSAEAIYRSAL